MARVVRDIDRGFKRLREQILGKRSGAGQAFGRLEVGVFGDIDPFAPTKMLINEVGTEHIPARPALSATFDSNRGPLYFAFAKAFSRALLRRGSAREAGLEAAGLLLSQRLRKTISEWSRPPNATSTITKKGFNDPLVASGSMRESVGFRIGTGPIRRST